MIFRIFFISLIFISSNSYSQESPAVNKQSQDKTVIIDNKEHSNKIKSSQEGSKEKTLKKPLNITDLITLPKKKVKSIMFSDKELKEIEKAIRAYHNKETLKEETADEEVKDEKEEKEVQKDKEQSKIYLNAILYIAKNNWIIWINGNKITTQSNNPSNAIYIKSINHNMADIVWRMGITKWKVLTQKEEVDEEIYNVITQTNQVEARFKLKINQTYNLTNNQITEGKN